MKRYHRRLSESLRRPDRVDLDEMSKCIHQSATGVCFDSNSFGTLSRSGFTIYDSTDEWERSYTACVASRARQQVKLEREKERSKLQTANFKNGVL